VLGIVIALDGVLLGVLVGLAFGCALVLSLDVLQAVAAT
jgi:hypothetical protein